LYAYKVGTQQDGDKRRHYQIEILEGAGCCHRRVPSNKKIGSRSMKKPSSDKDKGENYVVFGLGGTFTMRVR
jgi:hypothetical protein